MDVYIVVYGIDSIEVIVFWFVIGELEYLG